MQVHGDPRERRRAAACDRRARPSGRDVEDLRGGAPARHRRSGTTTPGSPTFTGPDRSAGRGVPRRLEDDARRAPACAYFVAELDGRVVGHLLLEPEEPDLARPPGSIYLAVAATLPEARGLGAGVALTDAALAWAADAGYTTVQTDWRVANLESSRFWPRRGFRETFYRIARRVNIG